MSFAEGMVRGVEAIWVRLENETLEAAKIEESKRLRLKTIYIEVNWGQNHDKPSQSVFLSTWDEISQFSQLRVFRFQVALISPPLLAPVVVNIEGVVDIKDKAKVEDKLMQSRFKRTHQERFGLYAPYFSVLGSRVVWYRSHSFFYFGILSTSIIIGCWELWSSFGVVNPDGWISRGDYDL